MNGSQRAVAALRAAGCGPHVVTIGNFDGVHRGHQHLIRLVREHGQAAGIRSLVITFEPHPTSVLRPDTPFERLTSPAAKLTLLHRTGVDAVVVVPFDLEFASLEPDAFLQLMTDTVHPRAVYVGEGFRFGRGRAGDGATIAAFGREAGFETIVIPRLRDGDVVISSSAIRSALHSGRVDAAATMLGRRYRLSGTVEHGVARGRELGYPTANLHVPNWTCIPKDGIYAAYAHVAGEDANARQAMVYIGSRPTFDNGDRLVEVNILDFDGDLYTREIEIEFVAFVRDDAAFETVAALVRQIAIDERETRAILGHSSPESR